MKTSLLAALLAILSAALVHSAPLGPSNFLEEAAKDVAAGSSKLKGTGASKSGGVFDFNELSEALSKLKPINTNRAKGAAEAGVAPPSTPRHSDQRGSGAWSDYPLQGKRGRADTPHASRSGTRTRY